MPSRTCSVCRARRQTTTMIPLGLDQGGSLTVGTPDTGKRAWICRRRHCVERAETHPGSIARHFKQRVKTPEDWKSQISAVRISHQTTLLRQAHRSGLVVSGRSQVIEQSDHLLAILLTADAGSGVSAEVTHSKSCISTYVIEANKTQIGHLLRTGPRSVLGLRSGRTTQSLIDSLQGWVSVG